MKAKVYTVADVKVSKKGEPYCVFAVQGPRNKVYKVLAFKKLATECAVIDRVGEEIIVDGSITQERGTNDDMVYLNTFILPERKKIKNPDAKVSASNRRPFKMWDDDDGLTWVRYLKEGEQGSEL